MSFRILSLEAIMEMKIAKLLWDISFKPQYLNLNEIIYDPERKWEIMLTDYRQKTLDILDSLILSNEIPFYSEFNLRALIYSFQTQYNQLFLWKITYDPLNKIDVFDKCMLYAPNYFNVCGKFFDNVLAAYFVLKSHFAITERFRLASLYWFSNECAKLWTEIKNSYFSSVGNLCEFFSNFEESIGIISLMILHLDFPSIEPEGDWRVEENFWKIVFEHSVEMGYKFAAYFSWQNIPESEKMEIIENDTFFELMYKCVEVLDGEICYFLYNRLSVERKFDLHAWTIENNKLEVWHSLIKHPRQAEHINEIFLFYYDVPIDMYFDLCNLLLHRIKQLHLLDDLEVLLVLWKSLTPIEKHNILESGELVKSLANRRSFFHLCQIIKDLVLTQKDDILLRDFYGAGVTILNILCKERESFWLQEYLGMFFLDIDINTRVSSLRKNAASFFLTFFKSFTFYTWFEMGMCERYEKDIIVAIEALERNIYTLHDLCHKQCEETSM